MTNGSTGEFYANTLEQQQQCIKTTVETVGGQVPVIAGVSQAQPAPLYRWPTMLKRLEQTALWWFVLIITMRAKRECTGTSRLLPKREYWDRGL